jgi:Holliday junction resolvase RusA-like endonuclease
MIAFTVWGKPEPAGSKRAFVNPKTQRAIVTDANKNAKPWQAEVKQRAIGALPDDFRMYRGPLMLQLTFSQPRPKGHYGTGRNAGVVKASAPRWPATRPDVLKLARAVEDALTGIIWADDAQIVVEQLNKVYSEPARCDVRIEPL